MSLWIGLMAVLGSAEASALRNLDMIVVLDRSGSMSGDAWDSSVQTLTSFASSPESAGIGMAMNFFPASDTPPAGDACAAGLYNPPQVALNSLPAGATAITSAMLDELPVGTSGPLYGALSGTYQWAAVRRASTPHRSVIVVLVTDGGISGCPNSQNEAAELANLAAAYSLNQIQTYVVAVGGGVADLNQIAFAGDTGQSIDLASDLSAFPSALQTIRASFPVAEICSDNEDNDFDTFEDCEDPDCYGFLGAADSGQALGNFRSTAVALADLDSDGDLDALVANSQAEPDRVWLNDGGWQGGGLGSYSDSGQALGSSTSTSVALADVDNDGDFDAFVGSAPVGAGAAGEANLVWLNDGSGTYTDSGQRLGSGWTQAVGLGDVDEDGDPDAFVATGVIAVNGADESNRVWLNDGSGNFADSGQILGASTSLSVALADLDGDTDLDAFVANYGEPNRVWLNDGSGTFTDTGQLLGDSSSASVALGDVDGDNDLDAFVANGGFALTGEPNRVWLNDGSGNFSDSGQILANSPSASVVLEDVDGDGDVDAFVGNDYSEPNKLYLNDGAGNFADNTQALGSSESLGVAMGDLDGDGQPEVFVANYGWPNRVWDVSMLCPSSLEVAVPALSPVAYAAATLLLLIFGSIRINGSFPAPCGGKLAREPRSRSRNPLEE